MYAGGFFEVISRYLEDCYYYWYDALSWKHIHNIETKEAVYLHQQKRELHDCVYKQNISHKLKALLEELKFY